MERSLYWYTGSLRKLADTYNTALSTKQVVRKVLFPPCSIKRIPLSITNKDDLTKENARIKLVLNANGYQESIFSIIFNRVSNNHSLSQSQQQTQTTDVQ